MFTLLITDSDFLTGGKLIDSVTESLKVILPLTRILTTKIYIYIFSCNPRLSHEN